MGLLDRFKASDSGARRTASVVGTGRAAREDVLAEAHIARTLVREYEDQTSGWFWMTDRLGRLTYVSDKLVAEIAPSGEPVLGQPVTQFFQMDSASPDTERTIAFHLTSRTGFVDYSVHPLQGDHNRWWSMSGRPVFDAIGQFQGFVGSGSDLTEKRKSEAEITRLALFDGLTGLANRQRMRLSLEQTLAQAGNGAYRTTSLFLLDLDRFKAVNDTLGHQTGDALLKQVAQRLLRTVGDAGLVGRLGGDEFKVVLPGESSRDKLSALSRSIIESLSQPYFIGGSSISIGCSIGVAIAPEDGTDAETLTRNADLALYAAKADGRGVHRFFQREMLEQARSRKLLEDDLRIALMKDQLHLAYQPVVSTRDQRIVGYEALVRWAHPVRGPVSPGEFIPVAEECGLIESIGEWVLRTAVAEAAKWPESVRVAINISPIQFANPALPAIIANLIARHSMSPARIELEITESVFLNDSATTDKMFKSLKALGVRLALDDFGTGYSSLGYLQRAPFNKIKIDQSFVRGATQPGSHNTAIIRAIVALAEALGMETTAEGVETQDEIELIAGLGCSHIQGYVYGKPAPCDVVARQLAEGAGAAVSPTGYRVSRAPRAKMLRWAKLRVGDQCGDVRIRNMSITGAMIDGVEFPLHAIGTNVQIELLEGEYFGATLRWSRGGQAGIRFDQPFNMERLNAPGARAVRRSG